MIQSKDRLRYSRISSLQTSMQIFKISNWKGTLWERLKKKNLPILLGKLMWAVEHDPSEGHSHIQVSDVKHICCAAAMKYSNITKI